MVLPHGWTVTPGALGRVPDEWHSLDTRSFEVDGKNGDQAFKLWFLPTDWIGIRQPDPKRKRVGYWEGVLMDSTYKSITRANHAAVHEAVRAMGMNTPSLVNSGWGSGLARFGHRLEDVDQHTQELVRRFCRTRACVDEAALSLIVLGVPARALTLDCAEHATGQSQEYCTFALGYWGDPASVRVLRAVVSSPGNSPRVRRNAALALRAVADVSAGSALREALQVTRGADREAATAITSTIGRIRYRPAAPDILARLMIESERQTQLRYSQALADLQYSPAIPAIERLCETTNVSADWLVRRRGDYYRLPELSLLRIRGTWGQPVGGIRLLLLAPEHPSVSGGIQVAALVENVGDADLDVRATRGVWIVDGKEYPNIDPGTFDGNPILPVNEVDMRPVDLARTLSTPGTHLVQYRLLRATSNQLTLQVR